MHPGDIAVFTAGDRSTSPVVSSASDGGPDVVAGTNVMYVVQIRDNKGAAQAGAASKEGNDVR